jgi:uncharacterized membrane protein
MNTYLLLKMIHILSSVLLVGTGFGSAFYLFFIHRTRNLEAIAAVGKLVVRADYWFTTPTIFIQPISGLGMLYLAGYSVTTLPGWISWSLALYVVSGACWLPVVWLQIRMARIAQQCLQQKNELPEQYWHYAKYWEWLGYPAFVAMLVIYYLMVFKPA